MSLLELRVALERDLAPPDYHRAMLRCGLVELVGLSAEDASAYVDGARLADLPQARALVDRRVRAILRCRLGVAP